MSRCVLLLLLFSLPARADDTTDTLAKELRDYATAELSKVGKDGKYSTALSDYLRKRIQRANEVDREEWNKIKSRADWEKFRDDRINALRQSLGTWPDVPKSVPTRVTKTIEADGYAIDNLLYESRPDVWVTGNLYRPNPKRDRMPVILIVHSHHAPKEQGELQDMGVTWAKLGCMVLVIDQLGHGERRQHPFATAKDYPKEFRVGRQDYYFRYNLNLQLSLVGDSLMGWLVWDLMRGLDVVLARPGADKDRVILLGAVAGGGDPAAVTAALDSRIKCVVPFNFGGPQPETRYPLPEDAEASFNYAGSGSWESTRNLRDSAAKGFLPWVIVASVAPRKVIHAHEFSWDRERDPVWKRYQKVWGFYDATDNLSFTHGTGVIQGNDPTASHCTNIGPVHRKGIYAALKKWFDIPVPETESKERRTAEELRCWSDEARRELIAKPLHEVLARTADEQLAACRRRAAKGPEFVDGREFEALGTWLHLGMREFGGANDVKANFPVKGLCELEWRLLALNKDGDTSGRLVLRPTRVTKDQPLNGVLCISEYSPWLFLRNHADAIATLVQSGIAISIPEYSFTRAGIPGMGRGRNALETSLTATGLMLGNPVYVFRGDNHPLQWSVSSLTNNETFDWENLVVWSESFAPTIQDQEHVALPQDLTQPAHAETHSAVFASLITNAYSFRALVSRGGLVSFRSVLDSPFIHVPFDALPRNVFRTGDLLDIWAHIAPKPLRLEGLVDGTNRRVTGGRLQKALEPVTQAYKEGGLVVKEDYTPDAELAKWIVEQLKK
jgi:dienelactone hydrolase